MRKFLLGVLVGILLTCASGLILAVFEHQRTSTAEAAARTALEKAKTAQRMLQAEARNNAEPAAPPNELSALAVEGR